MKIINPKLRDGASFLAYVNTVRIALVNENPKVREKIEYKMFNMIFEDVRDVFFSQVQIDYDYFGFRSIRRSTRAVIETFFDLCSYANDHQYLDIMKLCAGKKYLEEDMADIWERVKKTDYYKNKVNKNNYYFSLYDKKVFAEMAIDINCHSHYQIAENCHAYVHPNVFTITLKSIEEKEECLRDFLLINLQILSDSLYILLEAIKETSTVSFEYMRLLCESKRCDKNCQYCGNNAYFYSLKILEFELTVEERVNIFCR